MSSISLLQTGQAKRHESCTGKGKVSPINEVLRDGLQRTQSQIAVLTPSNARRMELSRRAVGRLITEHFCLAFCLQFFRPEPRLRRRSPTKAEPRSG